MGYAAETFASAEEYLQSDRVADTACLITDIQMPGMNGADLQDRLIADGYRMPIIFITAFPTRRLRARFERRRRSVSDQAFQRRKPDRVPGQGTRSGRTDPGSLIVAPVRFTVACGLEAGRRRASGRGEPTEYTHV